MAIINPNGSLPVDILSGAGSIDIDAWQYEKTSSFNAIIPYLFRNNEQGFAYDINNLSTLFQDAAGTIPVTAAGQPVGLMLDKSKGLVLGNEILKPFTDPSWSFSAGITVAADTLVFNNAPDGASAVYTSESAFVPRCFYVVEFDFISYTSGGGIYARIGSTNFTRISTTLGRKKLVLQAGSTGNFIQLAEGGGSGTYTLSNITVKELYGNHAYQTKSSMRPLLQNSPRKIDYDGVDDKLTVNLPAQLTGCTVIRAVPSVGTQILTNQTIATPYDDSTDHCGLIVINRALTQAETAQITQIFNRLAGV